MQKAASSLLHRKVHIKNDNAAGVALFQKNHTDLEAFAERCLNTLLEQTGYPSSTTLSFCMKLREVHQHATMTEYFLRRCTMQMNSKTSLTRLWLAIKCGVGLSHVFVEVEAVVKSLIAIVNCL